MRLILRSINLKHIIIFFVVFGLNINNCFAELTTESFLNPISSIDSGLLQNTFTRLANEQSYQDYKAIFAINPQSEPRRSLKGQELQEFLTALKDIRSIIEIFSQSHAFDGIMRLYEKDFIDDFLINHSQAVDLAKPSEIAEELKQIIESVLDRLAMRQRVQPSLAATIHKELIFRLKRKLEAGLSMLKPSMPIQSINFNQAILSYLKPETLKRIIENISWENHDPDAYSGQRKIILNLDQPIVLENGTIINSIEIKGVVYKDNGEVVPPLPEIYKILKIMRVNERSQTAMINRVHLKGAMPLKAASREYMVLEKLYAQGNYQYDYPIGFGRYKNYTFKGKQFGFVITGVENARRTRMADWFFNKYPHIFELVAVDKARFVKLAVDLFETHELFLREYGMELRRFHDAGFYHGYPHMLNVSWDKEYKNIVLNDFEASKFIAHLPGDRRVGYRIMDISSAYLHFIAFITGEDNLINLGAFSESMNSLGNPFRYFLEGYFGKDLENFDFDGFISESIFPAAIEGVDIINEMDQNVVSKLFRIEGLDYERFEYIDEIVLDEQAFLNELVCEQAI